MLTTYSDDESIIGALQAGALGYLTKDATRAEIGRAVLAAAAGQAVLDPEVQQRLLPAAVRGPAAPPAAGSADPADTDLTRRRIPLMCYSCAGASSAGAGGSRRFWRLTSVAWAARAVSQVCTSHCCAAAIPPGASAYRLRAPPGPRSGGDGQRQNGSPPENVLSGI